jgi:hypothetical protein
VHVTAPKSVSQHLDISDLVVDFWRQEAVWTLPAAFPVLGLPLVFLGRPTAGTSLLWQLIVVMLHTIGQQVAHMYL